MLLMEFIYDLFQAALSILNDSSPWLIGSFILAGLLHNILTPDKYQRMLGNKKLSSIIKSTISGMLLPICSCGVIPLGLSMYYSGAYLGPTLAFMTATPIINPAAVILSYGLLGPEIGTIYLIAGFVVPVIIGIVGNTFAGPELHVKGLEEGENAVSLEDEDTVSLKEKLVSGLKWGFSDLGLAVSKYVVPGMLLAGLILTLAPKDFIQDYLGDPGIVSLGGIAAIGAIMYVCAVGHIPFVAALVASGAAPGVAITFLMTGAATNLPELISIGKLIGKRTALIYSSVVVTASFIVGYIANKLLLPGFTPMVNYDRAQNSIKMANSIIVSTPDYIKYACSVIIFYLFVCAIVPKVKELIEKLSKVTAYEK